MNVDIARFSRRVARRGRQAAFVACAALAASGLIAAGANADGKPLSIEALAQHPDISGPALSPDGKHVAALVAPDGYEWPVISIWNADDLSERPVWVPSKEMRLRAVSFVSNDRILFFADSPLDVGKTKTFTVKAYTAKLDGTDIEEPMRRQGTLDDAVREAESRGVTVGIFRRLPDEKLLLEKTNVSNGSQEIYELDTKTGRTRIVAASGDSSFYVAAGVHPVNGELLLKQEIDNVGGDFWIKTYHRQSDSSPWVYQEPLSYALKQRSTIDVQGFDGDVNKLVVIHNKNTEFAKAYAYDAGSQTFSSEALFEHPSFDIASVGFGCSALASTCTDDETAGLSERDTTWVTVLGPSVETIFLDEYWGGVKAGLEQRFPDLMISLGSRRLKEKRAIVTISGPKNPPVYFLWDDGALKPLGGSRPWIDPASMGDSKWVTYTARDGLKIPAILTTPAGWTQAQGPVPAVVLPHGGPWARDFMGWDSSGWPQFLATRGVAVLQPQYRGSTGVGKSLWFAGDQEWGQKMQDDKDDGAAWMVSQGIAQSDKLGIFGYSYGGFAAIAASVRPNSPYQCAVAGAGVASLERLGNFWGANRIGKEVQAWTVTGMDPMKNVDQANIPILLYHGDRDRQADTDHSRMFYNAMRRADKDVRYVEIEDMWHQLPWWPQWHTESLSLIEDFFASDKCNRIITADARR